jgi:hypothetical protein
MGKPDDQRTAELDRTDEAATRPVTDGEHQMRLPRTQTLDDPLTTGLLAEVARRSQTVEFEPEVIETLLEQIDDADVEIDQKKSHPRVMRR